MSSTLLNSIPFIIESELNSRMELTERPCERHIAHTIVFLDFKCSRVFVLALYKNFIPSTTRYCYISQPP